MGCPARRLQCRRSKLAHIYYATGFPDVATASTRNPGDLFHVATDATTNSINYPKSVRPAAKNGKKHPPRFPQPPSALASFRAGVAKSIAANAKQVTTPVSAWFGRDASPPASVVSPIPHLNHRRARSCKVRGEREAGDHARECVVRTGRKSSSLGRKPDPPSQPPSALASFRAGVAKPSAANAKQVTTPVSAWFGRDASPPASVVSPIPHLNHRRRSRVSALELQSQARRTRSR